MGREVRRVHPEWQHPKDYWGKYLPLHDRSYVEAMAEWIHDGEHEDERPNHVFYRPEWSDDIRTAYQVYETVTEGTPISPVFQTREELIDWLVNCGTRMGISGSAHKMSREQAERFADAGWAPTARLQPG